MSALGEVDAVLHPARSEGVRESRPRRKLRLLLVQTQAENAGAQEISRLLSERLGARGYDVHQLFFFRRTASFDGVYQTVFAAEKRPSGPLQVALLFGRLVREMRQTKPDVVLTFQHYGNLLGAAAARLARAPAVIANQVSATLTTPGWARRMDRLVGAAGLFDRIVVNSSDAEQEFRAYSKRYRDRLVRIEHGFLDKTSPLTKGEARRLFGLPADCVLIGSVARLHALKNLEAAIRLLPHEERWHLTLAGQGEAEADLVDLALRLGCRERVHFLGELPSRAVGDFLAALDLFAFPSLAETFGLAAVEAAQAGVPVVANDLEVLREVLAVEGEPCAAFADASDPEAFLRQVRRVLRDPALAATLVARGRRLKLRYSLDAMTDAYERLIQEVAAETRSYRTA
jgi:L-malate glycosyltransferase